MLKNMNSCDNRCAEKMKKIILLISSILLITLSSGCDQHGGKLSKPEDAHIDLSDNTINRIDAKLSPILFRYLAGNPRWEIREQHGLRYAIRIEPVNEKYETTLNGFYSYYESGVVRQNRVLLSFGKEHGFGRDRGNITRAKAGKKDVAVIIENEHEGTPGNASYTIISGGAVVLEIYDQAPEISRKFTQQAFAEVSAELKDVITHRDVIQKDGVLPVEKYYPKPFARKSYFDVKDGLQPGIYRVVAAASLSEPGFAYVKAFNVKTGDQLSEQQIKTRSTRYMGWSKNGETLFPYNSQITIYEGDWSSSYEARFELWHRSQSGIEKKLAEKVRLINGWER